MDGRALSAIVASLAAACLAAKQAAPQAKHEAVAKAVAPSLVQVEYWLRVGEGDAPRGAYYRRPIETYVEEERPLELAGFLVSPTRAVVLDPLTPPRFIERIAVRFRSHVVPARPAAYARDQNAVFLELARPLEGTRPLAFESERKPPWLMVTSARLGEAWTTHIQPMSRRVCLREGSRPFASVPAGGLIVDEGGGPVGLSMTGELPLDGSWKGSPLAWPAVSAEAMARKLKELDRGSSRALLRVALRFRTPKGSSPRRYWRYDRESEAAAERHVVGVLVGPKTILILADLRARVTARLEHILVFPPKGGPLRARFAGSLAEHGCLLAQLERPLAGALELSPHGVLGLRHKLLLAAHVAVKGETRVAWLSRCCITGFQLGRRRRVHPVVPRVPTEGLFLFDLEGSLAVLPIPPRTRLWLKERWSSDEPVLTPAACLRDALREPARHIDASNVPRPEAEARRLAWMGVVLQRLNKELARANKVAHLTEDGESGALVAYVYPGSPAHRAGIQPGFILLRLRVEGWPLPLDVKLEERDFPRQPFPWHHLDRLAPEQFEHVPPPWPSVENQFTRTLTDIGFGKRYTADFFHDGKAIRKKLVIEQGPPHYDAAPRHKSKALGLTVRDLTFEVRRYLKKTADQPGVVISKIDRGSKAAVAGLKPYEVITHVNGAAVTNVGQFQKQLQGQAELRLSVSRMARSRVVEIKLPTPKAP